MTWTSVLQAPLTDRFQPRRWTGWCRVDGGYKHSVTTRRFCSPTSCCARHWPVRQVRHSSRGDQTERVRHESTHGRSPESRRNPPLARIESGATRPSAPNSATTRPAGRSTVELARESRPRPRLKERGFVTMCRRDRRSNVAQSTGLSPSGTCHQPTGARRRTRTGACADGGNSRVSP